MSGQFSSVIHVMEVIARSQNSWAEAAQKGVSLAYKKVKNIRSVKVKDMTAQVSDGCIDEYVVRISILYDAD